MIETVPEIKPKLGFAGVGWIGRNRMRAINRSRMAEMAAAADPDPAAFNELDLDLPALREYSSFRELLESDLDGIVIATPSALHAEQALAALKSGKAVFCQKPLGINARETAEVVAAARSRNRLLEVDFSYRHTQALKQVKQTVGSGRLGDIYGINLTFHNAYGPGKSWYRNPSLSGGGCLMDLGIHLVDLLFWIFDRPEITGIRSHLCRNGVRLDPGRGENGSHGRSQNGEQAADSRPRDNSRKVEDYATAQFTLNGNTAVQLSCSWNLPAGREAVIEAAFYGERGGIAFRNREGSFYDFVAEEYSGTSAEIVTEPPDDWGGRAAVEWTRKLAGGNTFNPEAEIYTDVAETVDLLYNNCS